MAITIEQINSALSARDKDPVTASQMREALDYALAVYAIPHATLYGDTPAERLITGIALLAEQAPFATIQTAQLTSSEIKAASGASVKKDFADAPSDPYPVISGLLAPFSTKAQSRGITFGVNVR